MISIKAIVALSLTGLGAGVTTANVLRANAPHETPAMRSEPEVRLKAEPPRNAAPGAAAVNAVVTLDPVMVLGALPVRLVREVPAPPRQLVPCSKWRDVASGPEGHVVRELCWADTTD